MYRRYIHYVHFKVDDVFWGIPYSWKIWWGIKFGGLAVYLCNCQIKICQYFIQCHAYIRMVIPYRTAKFKFTNIFAVAIWRSTVKFNSRQYFCLYSITTYSLVQDHHTYIRNFNLAVAVEDYINCQILHLW